MDMKTFQPCLDYAFFFLTVFEYEHIGECDEITNELFSELGSVAHMVERALKDNGIPYEKHLLEYVVIITGLNLANLLEAFDDAEPLFIPLPKFPAFNDPMMIGFEKLVEFGLLTHVDNDHVAVTQFYYDNYFDFVTQDREVHLPPPDAFERYMGSASSTMQSAPTRKQ